MNIVDWFDPHNLQHLRAYDHLRRVGYWPEGFIPPEVKIMGHECWQVLIINKMADCWVHRMLEIDQETSDGSRH